VIIAAHELKPGLVLDLVCQQTPRSVRRLVSQLSRVRRAREKPVERLGPLFAHRGTLAVAHDGKNLVAHWVALVVQALLCVFVAQQSSCNVIVFCRREKIVDSSNVVKVPLQPRHMVCCVVFVKAHGVLCCVCEGTWCVVFVKPHGVLCCVVFVKAHGVLCCVCEGACECAATRQISTEPPAL
jgi:hypothetical protein